MNPAFDKVAASYDQEFTDTPIGRAQRDRVWRYMRKVLSKYKQARILELNCGTGEDAVFMAEMGHEVLATDISTEMLAQTQQKATKAKLQDRIRVKQLDLADPKLEGEAPFDVIFSNFGGLNCVSGEELEKVADFCDQHLNNGGVCVFVVMPPKTFLEKGYRWWKGESSIYTERSSYDPIKVRVGEEEILTYFHSPSDIKQDFTPFLPQKTIPIGFIPSYFNSSKYARLFHVFDRFCHLIYLPANRSDHYLIQLNKEV